MKAVILAGGRGTRLSGEHALLPKALVEVGGRPIIWHIMSIFSRFGVNDFIVCLGYRGDQIREYFLRYYEYNADLTVDLGNNRVAFHNKPSTPWRVTLVDTGLDTMTGGRLRAVRPQLDDSTFFMTYGDAVSDVPLDRVLAQHQWSDSAATVTAVRPSGRFGALTLDGSSVTKFEEKPQGDSGYVNGGFFALEPRALDSIQGPETLWEHGPLEALARAGQLEAYKHDGYWQCMDTPRDRDELEMRFREGAPWLSSDPS